MSRFAKHIAGAPGRFFTAIATLGPLGTRMPAPGTWGTGAGLLLYSVFLARFNNAGNWPIFVGISVALLLFAVAVCWIGELQMGRKDPGEIILDELVAMPLVFTGAESFLSGTGHYSWGWTLIGFVLFRIFDVAKPFGIKKLQAWRGGLGIVADDVAAAAAACISLHALHLLSLLLPA
ncbi:MAG: phosphatidylglycerophosphatase A [Puniceicoccales bacterium]|jgi:phosphatidylglycerophosphatase A|nr:phosphatidylglycerophosphatase A [Puniceicoccales bacterium]